MEARTITEEVAEMTATDTAVSDATMTEVLGRIDGIKDAITVKRVFGDPYEVAGTTVIPVAAVRGGGGGGGGGGMGPEGEGGPSTGSGAGMGFGIADRPIGVYEVRDGEVVWRPSVDKTKVIVGFQVLAGLTILVVARVLLRLSRR
jgi:uncharacterized spore protein YtfJ